MSSPDVSSLASCALEEACDRLAGVSGRWESALTHFRKSKEKGEGIGTGSGNEHVFQNVPQFCFQYKPVYKTNAALERK